MYWNTYRKAWDFPVGTGLIYYTFFGTPYPVICNYLDMSEYITMNTYWCVTYWKYHLHNVVEVSYISRHAYYQTDLRAHLSNVYMCSVSRKTSNINKWTNAPESILIPRPRYACSVFTFFIIYNISGEIYVLWVSESPHEVDLLATFLVLYTYYLISLTRAVTLHRSYYNVRNTGTTRNSNVIR